MNSGSKLQPELLINIVNEIPYAILISNPEGQFLFWNKQAFKLFKKELTDSTQSNWAEDWGVYSLDKTTLYKTEDIPLSRALRGEWVNVEKLYLQKAGRESMYLKVTAFPVFDKNTNVKAGVVMCEDVTQEQKLYESIIHKINDLETYLQDIMLSNITN